MTTVQTVGEGEAEQAIATLTLAFATDPVIRSFYPEPLEHFEHFPEMMRISVPEAIECGTAFVAEGFRAAMVWFSPARTEEAAAAAERRVGRQSELIRTTARPDGNDDLFAVLAEMDKLHPQEPHWYLLGIGVDPHHQNEGLGSVLMEHMLPRCDADGTLAYLESSNPRNVPFYLRHGFEVTHELQIGSSPTLTLMTREPRSRS